MPSVIAPQADTQALSQAGKLCFFSFSFFFLNLAEAQDFAPPVLGVPWRHGALLVRYAAHGGETHASYR